MLRALRALLLGASVVVLSVPASCSLDLDAARIGGLDGGPNGGDGATGDGAGGDGSADAAAPVGPIPCTNDEACVTTHGCLKGKCDLARKACAFDVCRPAACSAAVCDPGPRTCGAPVPYKFRAAQFQLGTSIQCSRCAVAIHPWLFVTTPAGVVAINVSNPLAGAPATVPVVGLGFVPRQMAQSGSRVWMLGDVSGPGPSRLQLAYIDAPADPFTPQITARSVLATSSRASEALSLFGRENDSALLVGPAAAQFPSIFLEPPLVEPLALTATVFTPPADTAPVALSGKRLLMAGVAAQVPTFTFVDNAGGPAPPVGAPVTIADAGTVSTSRALGQSADGAVFWATGVHHIVPPDIPRTRAVRGYFLLPNGAAPLAPVTGIDLEVLDVVGNEVTTNASVVGPVAMLDANTALVTTMAREAAAQSVVQFVQRDPLAVIKAADNTTPLRSLIGTPLSNILAATASNGIGYVLANDVVGPPVGATVYVFDPACK